MRLSLFCCLSVAVLSSAAAVDPGDVDASRFTLAQNRSFEGLGQDQEGRWREPFFFMQMADTQYGMFTGDKGFEKERELVTKAVAHINRLKPRFVIVCGDLTNATPKHDRYASQVQQFKRDFSQVSPEIPLVCVCGNHDIGNRPNPSSIASYSEHFGDDYFGFWVGGVRSLVLNSSVIKDPTESKDVLERQDKWLRRMLVEARQAEAVHVLVFQHHPWFLKTPDEKDQYFNLPIDYRTKTLALMREAGVRAIFAGHYHRNAYGKDGDMEMITTGPVGRPLGKDPSGFRIVRVFEDRIDHSYYPIDAVPNVVSMAIDSAPSAND